MGVVQWNPHWECFVKSDECRADAQVKMTNMLALSDFGTAVMFEVEYQPPTSHYMKQTTCGRTPVSMFWDHTKWEATDIETVGCMYRNATDPKQDDRPFIIKSFMNKDAGQAGVEVLMVSAHFPHPTDASAPFDGKFAEELMHAIADSSSQKPNAGIVFAADTNLDFSDSNDDIMRYLGVPGDIVGSTPSHTCCYNDGYQYAPDRVATNMQGHVSLELFLNDPTPAWAKIEGAGFHKPVFTRFSFDSVSAACSDHPVCADLGLAGNCCPTSDNVLLDCCNAAIVQVNGSYVI